MTMSSSGATARPRQRSFWIAVICGAVILTIGMGARQSFGIFQKPIAADLKVGRELWSFANALAMLLMGVFSPFVGNLADRFGTARTVAAGGVLYVIGMFMIAFAADGVMLTLGNVLCGMACRLRGLGRSLAPSAGRRRPKDARPRSASPPPVDRSVSSPSYRLHPCCSTACPRSARATRRSRKGRRGDPPRQR